MKIISKLLIINSILLFAALNSQAQNDLERLMTRRLPSCQDIALNGIELITTYYKAGQYDKVNQVLKYWEDKCGMSEPLMRMKILMAIQERQFNENLYNEMIMRDLTSFMNDSLKLPLPIQTDLNLQQKLIAQTMFDYHAFTQTIAERLLPQQQPKTLEHFFCAFYANQLKEPFERLKQLNKPAQLEAYYQTAIDKYRFLPDLYATIYTGVWIPQQKARLLGNHPSFGFGLGWQKRKMRYLMSLAFRFSDAPTEYQTIYKNRLVTTNHFFGGYFGVDLERTLLQRQKHQWELLGGIGFDGFDTLSAAQSDEYDGKSINSMNLNVGLGYKYFYYKRASLALNAKYNFVKYENIGGTDLTGNTITVGLVVGILYNEAKEIALNALRYKNFF